MVPSERRAQFREQEAALNERFARAMSDAIDGQELLASDVAYMLGLDESAVSRYRNGQQKPSIGRAAMIASKLGLSLDEVLEDW